jgi:hypothetical protein
MKEIAMFPSGYKTLIFWSMAACGLAIAFPEQVRSQQTATAEKPSQLKEWEFPGAESHRSSTTGGVFAADYATSKPFEEVWTYYAKKLGCNQEYKPNLTHAGSSSEFGTGRKTTNSTLIIHNSTNDPGAARVRRPSAKSATLLRRGTDGRNVTIFISRAKDEDKTYFTLVLEGK